MACACLPERKLISHIFVLLCISVLSILFVSKWREKTSSALLLSNVNNNVYFGGLAEFMLLKIYCVRSLRRVLVECRFHKPC